MAVGVRCFECKTKVKGWGTGREHANLTGHTWQPGYYCTDCEQTFTKRKLCKHHIQAAGVHSKTTPSKARTSVAATPATSSSSSASATTPPVPPGRLVPLAIGVPRPDISSLSGPETGAKTENGEPSSSSLQCTMCRLPAAFSSKESLEQHLAQTSTCTKCGIHFYEPEKLQEHYRTSGAHPRCRECGDGFLGVNEWATHRARCPPPRPPGDAAELTRNTSAPQSISDGFSVVSVSASVGGSDVVSRDDRALEPSELSSVAPSSPLFDPTVVATRRSQDTDTVDNDSISDRISVSRDTAGTPVSVSLSVTENFDDPDDARALQDSPEPPKAGVKGKSKAPLSSNGAATPTTATTTLEGEGSSQRLQAKSPTTAKPKPLSFHCRSCLADPCVKPVATLCGHIFCHSCIVRELATKMACPVCQRLFLVRLHVGVA